MAQGMRLRSKADCTAFDKDTKSVNGSSPCREFQGKQEGAKGHEPSQQTEAHKKQETPEGKYHRCTCCSRLLSFLWGISSQHACACKSQPASAVHEPRAGPEHGQVIGHPMTAGLMWIWTPRKTAS